MPHYNLLKARPSLRSIKSGAMPQGTNPRLNSPSDTPPSALPTQGDAMDIDIHKLVSEAILQTQVHVQAIPFPATPTPIQYSDIDAGQSRTRKRSRTTALLPNPSHKRSRTPSATTDTPSSIPLPRHHAKRQRTADPLTDASSSLNSLSQIPNKPDDKPSRVPSASATHSSAPLPVLPSGTETARVRTDAPTPSRTAVSSLPRRKRPTAGEIQTLIFLYRSLVYGLKVLHTRPTSTFNIYASPEPSIYLDDPNRRGHLYDNLLARRIRAYLLYLGVDRNILEVDTNGIRAEVLEFGTPKEEIPDTDARFAHPCLYRFTNCSVLSYPQLVATLIMRHRAKAQRPSTPKQPFRRNNRPVSSLRSHIVQDSD